MNYFLGAGDESTTDDVTLHALARAANDLTEEDKREVLRFAEYLRIYGRNRGTS